MPLLRLLGKEPAEKDPRTLKLAHYFTPQLPAPPSACLWQTPVTQWGIQGNDRFGNCVICTPAHLIQSWRANDAHDPAPISDNAVISLSRHMRALHGYSILRRLKYWRTTGMWSNKLTAFAAIDPTDQNQIRVAVSEFGGADIGLNMPEAWADSEIWGTGTGADFRAGSWGGHSVPIVGYDADFLYVVTWGAIQRMTWAVLPEYCDEAYALIDSAWLGEDKTTPLGFALEQLTADLAEVAQ